MQSARFLADFSASAAYPRPLEARPAETRLGSEGVISKSRVTKKKGSNGCQRRGSAPSFSTGPCSTAPLSVGVVRYQRETHSQARHAEAGFDLDVFVTVWDEG